MTLYDRSRVSVFVAVDPVTAFDVFTTDIDVWWKRGPAFRFDATRQGTLRFEPGEGGRLVEVYDEAAGDLWEVGQVQVWEPGKRLVFASRIPTFEPHQTTEVEVTFAAEGDGTLVTLEHRGWDGIPRDHPAKHGQPDAEVANERSHWWLLQLRAARGHAASRLSG